MSVSPISIAFMAVSALLAGVLPIVLIVHFYIREKYSLKAVVVGALAFFISQMVLRIPLINILSVQPWWQALAANFFMLAIILSFTAGLFEETARYIGFRFVLKNKLSWKTGLAFGLGHGGIESVMLI